MLNLARERLLASTIISGFAASFFAAGVAAAQAPEPAAPAADAASAEEEVVVTGSRVKRPGLTSASPITTIDSTELNLKQTPEIERVLRDLPAAVPGDGANVNNGTAGAATVDLRSLGENRTLVLLDGKRMVPFSTAGVVDISIIPVALLERVDVVTGGASAVYGSDAVAGAVNFILKKNFEGVALDTSYSITGAGDGGTFNSTGTIGANLDEDRGNVTLTLNYTNRKPIQLGARDYGLFEAVSSSGAGVGAPPPDPVANCSATNTYANSGTVVSTTLPTVLTVRAGTPLQVRNDGTLGDRCNVFNFNPYNYYQTSQERYSFLATAEYDVNDNITAYARAMFQNTYVRQQIAPSGLFNNTFDIPLSNPFLTASQRTTLINRYNAFRAANPTVTAAQLGWTDRNGNNVIDAPDSLSMGVRRRTPELGERSTTFENNIYQILIGAKGEIGGGWDYDLSYQHGRSKQVQVNAGYTNIANAAIAVNTISATTCTTPGGTTTDGCVPLNIFGPEGSITPAMAAYSAATAILDSVYTQDIVSANITGSLGSLASPWASEPISVAFGMEYRMEEGNTTPDECLKLAPTSCLGGAGGNTLPLGSSFDVYEIYGEAIVPILQDLPFAKELTLELGVRYSEYSSAGQNTTYKVGLDWAPIESLRLRAMFNRAVRAPNIGEIGSPNTSGLDNAQFDYCSSGNPNVISASLRSLCISTGVDAFFFTAVPGGFVSTVPDIAAGQINSFAGTDLADLPGSETAETFTAGFVFTPDFGDEFDNVSFSVDYYKIDVADPIGTFSGQDVLDGCYVANIASFCDKVVRINSSLETPGSGVELYTTNLVYVKAEGVEIAASIGFELAEMFGGEEAGRLDFSFLGNMYLSNEYQNAPTSEVVDCLGHYGNACGDVTHEYRWVQRTTYTIGDLSVSALWRHLSEVTIIPDESAALFSGFRKIGAYDYLDLAVTYQILEEAGLTFAATNVFDRDPPIIGNTTGPTDINSGNTFPSNYDSVGTVYSLGVNLRF